jgi:hypothetical protein
MVTLTPVAAVHPMREKRGISPVQLAMVTVLQFTGDLTGRPPWSLCPECEAVILSALRHV